MLIRLNSDLTHKLYRREFGLQEMIYLLLAFLTTIASAGPSDLGFLAYGDLRGHLEPCGCDPSTDLGGIKRLATVVARERSIHPELLLFDLGNALPLPSESELKTKFILETQARLRPNAILFNELEFSRPKAIAAWLEAHQDQNFPYVLSNTLTSEAASKFTREKLSGSGWVVMGYVQRTALAPHLEPISKKLLDRWSLILAPHSRDLRILLFAGSDSELRQIIDSSLFTTIISSNTSKLDALPGAEDRHQESRLRRMMMPSVHMVPLAGQGFLRGGRMQVEEAPSLATLLAQTQQKRNTADTPDWLREGKQITWLDPASASSGSPVDDIYLAYSEAARGAFLKSASKRRELLKDSPYAGSESCAGCHPGAYQSYLGTKHANALKTLQNKGKHEDPSCIGCHVLGASDPGGYVSIEASPKFANVQCENCHGPRLKHTMDPKKYPGLTKPDKNTCLSCHNKQHSPHFDYEVYWPRIQHK